MSAPSAPAHISIEDFYPPVAFTLSPNARRVLEIINSYAKGAWGYCGAFQETLARVLGRSVRWLASALAELKAAGLLTVQQRGPHAAAMRLTIKGAELFAELLRPSSITESKAESWSGSNHSNQTKTAGRWWKRSTSARKPKETDRERFERWAAERGIA